MYRVKLVKSDGTVEYKRFRGITEADAVARASVTNGEARQAYVYVDSPGGLKLREICTDLKGEDDGREDD